LRQNNYLSEISPIYFQCNLSAINLKSKKKIKNSLGGRGERGKRKEERGKRKGERAANIVPLGCGKNRAKRGESHSQNI